MSEPDDLLERAEALAGSEPVTRFAVACWQDPKLSVRFEERPAETLAEFGIELPDGLDLVPLGTGWLGKPGPDFTPFEIRFSRCRTVVVRDPETKRLKTETVCFGFEIVPKVLPGGPIA
jgi:hypothetical protein